MATGMVLQRLEGSSDREAVDRLQFDLRCKWACGLAYDSPCFDSTWLVDMRARLRNSTNPDRFFHAVLDVAKSAHLVGRKLIVDSTALYDAVATQDTVTLVRNSVVGVLRTVDRSTGNQLRCLLTRDADANDTQSDNANDDRPRAHSGAQPALATTSLRAAHRHTTRQSQP